MTYPTLEAVEQADHLQLCRWQRFLPGPGSSAVNRDAVAFDAVLRKEVPVMDRIVERVKELGGFTSTISKIIGW